MLASPVKVVVLRPGPPRVHHERGAALDLPGPEGDGGPGRQGRCCSTRSPRCRRCSTSSRSRTSGRCSGASRSSTTTWTRCRRRSRKASSPGPSGPKRAVAHPPGSGGAGQGHDHRATHPPPGRRGAPGAHRAGRAHPPRAGPDRVAQPVRGREAGPQPLRPGEHLARLRGDARGPARPPAGAGRRRADQVPRGLHAPGGPSSTSCSGSTPTPWCRTTATAGCSTSSGPRAPSGPPRRRR